ncbi:MAG: aspartate kinase [Bacteroidia bacterium]
MYGSYWVMKFGGTSVGSAQRMHALVERIHDDRPKIIVLSAMAGTTDHLLAIAQALHNQDIQTAQTLIQNLQKSYDHVVEELYYTPQGKQKGKQLLLNHVNYLHSFTLREFSPKDEKKILAQGELLSTSLFHFYLEEVGLPSVLLSALDFMRLDENGEPDMNYLEAHLTALLRQYPEHKLFLTQGYICRNAFGQIDNLKRGGSDYTATLIGAVLHAPEIQIWTDIDGMHNNDPRVVPNTQPLEELSFEEAAELAYFGAKILHPTCVLPAQKRNIPVRLLNTLQPRAKGTLISQKGSNKNITAVAAKEGITAIKIQSAHMLLAYGFLRAVFEVFERYKTPIDMITTSEVAVSLTIDDTTHLEEILSELKSFSTVDVDRDQTIICIVGNFTPDTQGYAFKIFEALQHIPIRMISYGGSPHNISLLVDNRHKKEALQALHKRLFLS